MRVNICGRLFFCISVFFVFFVVQICFLSGMGLN